MKRIAVAGSANTDVVLSLDAPIEDGQSVVTNSQKTVAGGKGANRAVALQRLGENPLFSCCIGGDSFGKKLLTLFEGEGLDTSLVTVCEGSDTGTAYIMLDSSGGNRIIVYSGANALFGHDSISGIVSSLPGISMLSMELEIPVEAVERLNFEAIKHGVPTVIDAGPIRGCIPAGVFKGAYILSPNESEAKALTGISVDTVNDARDACRVLFEYGVIYALIKLGARGSICYDGSDYIVCPAFDTGKSVADTTAAGDSYMAALTKALSHGSGIEAAMRYASVAAGIAVTRFGAIPSLPYNKEVDLYTF